jgi:hypothetical protein
VIEFDIITQDHLTKHIPNGHRSNPIPWKIQHHPRIAIKRSTPQITTTGPSIDINPASNLGKGIVEATTAINLPARANSITAYL